MPQNHYVMRTPIFIALILLVPLLLSAQQADRTYTNPILPGYHPDPSICRSGDDYYLVNSSFEWFPGIPVYHSRDLVNWELIAYGINRPGQLPLDKGTGDSRGIFAVSIREHDGIFYLITTCVDCGGNFYLTAPDPSGPWSDPVWLDAPGIDPSLMWDSDGRCYYVGNGNLTGSQAWPSQQGAWLQELDLQEKKLTGPRTQLTHGHASNAVWAEGPHLYKIDGKYLLTIAEGGTGFNHAVTVHHSDSLRGPYIPDQTNPVMTHRHLGREYPVQCTGHADLVQTQNGDWWAVLLATRVEKGYTQLARETFLAPVTMENGTPVFNPGSGHLPVQAAVPDLPFTPAEPEPSKDEFDGDRLPLYWNMLRAPETEWFDLNGGQLLLTLRSARIDSLDNPSFLARRIEHHRFTATTSVSFKAADDSEMAGLVLYRNSKHHFQLMKGHDEILLIRTDGPEQEIVARVPWKKKDVLLSAEADGKDVRFYFGSTHCELQPIGEVQVLRILSDERAGGFNGPYTGMYAVSDTDKSHTAAFDWFEYRGKANE